MLQNSLFRSYSNLLRDNLQEIHRLIRLSQLDEASQLLGHCCSMSNEYLVNEIAREVEFLKIIDASNNISADGSKFGITPRQALIYAALCGWRGDEPNSWISPIEKESIIDWGVSQYGGDRNHIKIAFDALILQGLYFEVHPTVFQNPCYYCTFEPEFLNELPDCKYHKYLWEDFQSRYNDEYMFTWLHTGLCAGQGSQGPSDGRWGPCLGTSCSWFLSGDECCNHQLKFNKELVKIRQAQIPLDLK